jgi:hypothetical protein
MIQKGISNLDHSIHDICGMDEKNRHVCGKAVVVKTEGF